MAEATGHASGTAQGFVGRVIGTVRGNVNAVLTETAAAELSLANAYNSARRLYIWGLLPRRMYDDYEQRRREVYGVQRAVYDAIVRVLPQYTVGGTIPAPVEYPSLPPWSAMPRAGANAEAGPGTQGLRGLGDAAGLGVVPAIVWAVAVLATLAQIIVVVAVIWIGADLVARVFGMRENTRRFELTVDDARARFDRCIADTQDVARCAGLFPQPDLPLENTDPAQLPFNTDPVMIGAGIAAVVLAIGVVGYFFYEFATPGRLGAWRESARSSSSRASSTSSGGGTKGLGSTRRRLSGDAVSRALRGGG